MANDEVLGPRKTMFVLVIVVGCFAVLWPRILSPLIIGHTQEHLKPNQFDREAGCCEVMFETEIAVLELVNEVCSSAIGVGGKLSPYLATECRKAVNDTCGVDIAAFLKRNDNVGKTTKMLVETMKNSNGSCLKEHFGVQLSSLNTHPALNSWVQEDTLKQERSPMRGIGPHPALRERGRAIPPGVPTPAQQHPPTQLPPHIRPPPIPGMRPPLGAPGGPVPAPKSSMGFVMPIYTICIIVFFVYTLSKILFKRTGSPYESIAPDPQFRRRVFRDDSRSSPDKLGPKERDAIVTAISGLVAEVRQQMEASDAQCQQRQEAQDNTARPYTNGTILLNSGPVQIIASEFQDSKEKTQEEQKQSSEQKDSIPEADLLSQVKEISENNVDDLNKTEIVDDLLIESKEEEKYPIHKEFSHEPEVIREQSIPSDNNEHLKDLTQEKIVIVDEEQLTKDKEEKEVIIEKETHESDIKESHEADIKKTVNANQDEKKTEKVNGDNLCEDKVDLIALSEDVDSNKENDLAHGTELFIQEEKKSSENEEKSTSELLEEALKEESPNDQEEEEDNQENSSVKVLGMEVTAHAADGGAWPGSEPPLATAPPTQPHKPPHEADDVKSIFLETEIPQQARVLVADFAENRTDRAKPKYAPLVVSGKMTLSLIQDAPRETPERDPESTVDDYTTASAATHPLAEKEEDLSEEEIEEEIEIEEIEEEVEEEEDEEEENEPKNTPKMGKV